MNATKTIPSKLVNITDTSFSKDNAGNYWLIIASQPTHISFALYLKKENKFTALHEYKVTDYSKVSEIIKKAGYAKCGFSKVVLAVVTPIASLLPTSLVKEGKLPELLGLNHSITTDKIYIDKLTNSDIAQLYQPHPAITTAIKAVFPQTEIRHFSSALLDSLLKKQKSSPQGGESKKEQIAYLYLHDTQFQLILFNQGKLIFSNWFDYSSDEDILYYVLYTLEQLQFDNNQTELNIMGKVKKEAALVSVTKKYLPHVNFADKIKDVNFTAPFEQLELNSYYGIFYQPIHTI